MRSWYPLRLLAAARRLLFLVGLVLAAGGAAWGQTPIVGLPNWQWQNPAPTGYELSDIHVFNDSTAIVVGGHGTCLKTRDRGRTWQALNVGTQQRLNFVTFANDLVGWIGVMVPPSNHIGPFPVYLYGGKGEVRKTTDGGLTWTRQQFSVEGTRIWGLQAVSPTECYVMHDEATCRNPNLPCGGYPAIRMRHTVNGGTAWPLTNPAWPFPFNSGTRFVSPLVGYTGVNDGNNQGSVQKTTDGGLTWRTVTPAPDESYGAVCFTDSLHGWVTSYHYDFISYRGPNLFRTRDGGRTWTAQRARAQPQDSAGALTAIAFSDSLRGVAAGNYGLTFRTDDGGITWQAVTKPQQQALALYVLPYNGLNALKARVGGRSLWALSSAGRVDYSPDYGATWTTVTQNVMPLLAAVQFPLKSVQVVSPTEAWALSSYQLLHTTRRGEPWSVVPFDSLPGLTPGPRNQNTPAADARALQFIDRDTGFVLAQYQTNGSSFDQTAAVARTTDGGRTWSAQIIIPTVLVDPFSYFHPAGVQAMAFGSARRGLVVGEKGTILGTADGGLTWTPRPSPTARSLRYVGWAGTGAQTAYIGGDGGTLLRSDDGGLTWAKVRIDSSSFMITPNQFWPAVFDTTQLTTGFQFITPEVGYMPIRNGIGKTTDGGHTWTSRTNLEWQGSINTFGGASAESRNVHFRTPREGWYFGDDNFRTQDGGTTWTKTPDVLGDSYSSPVGYGQMADRYNAYTVGYNGVILRYSEKFIRTDTTLARTSFCMEGATDSVSVPFALDGTFSPAERDFRVELSNAKGRFRPGETRVVGQGTASPLLARLPASLPAGTYRLRVVRADSSVFGADNGVDLLINRRPTAPTLTPADSVAICQGDTVYLMAPAGFGVYQWSTGATTRALGVYTAGTYVVRVGGATDCLSPPSDSVRVRVKAVPVQPLISVAPQASGITVLTSSAATGNQWFLNGAPISGATGPTYAVTTAAQSGAYSVRVTRAGCVSPVSAAVAVGVTGLTDEAAGAALTLSPNPARGRVAVRASGGGLLNVSLTDLSGRQVTRVASAGRSEESISLTGVAAGSYLLRAEVVGGQLLTRRLVVEK